jgi:putative ABC transport system permease protein
MIPGARFLEFSGHAAKNLARQPLRSLLTALGVVFGVASVVTMLGLGRGAEQQLLREFDRLGITNVILDSVKPPESRKAGDKRNWISKYGITFKDYEQVKATVPGIVRALPVHKYVDRAWYGSRKEEVDVLGVLPEHFAATKLSVARGRALNEEDERERAAVCVVHVALLRALGWYGEPIGHKLLVGEQIYEVVGLLDDQEFRGTLRKALSTPEAGENEIYAPYQTVLARRGTMSVSRKSGSFEATNIELNQIVVEAATQADVLPVARMLRAILERFHTDKDYRITVPLELLEQKRRTQQVFNVALLLIAGISLLVGGIGIANIMLATVTERTREIGVRRAIGATRRTVMNQFLTETVTLAAAGGVLGVALGAGGVALLRWYTGWEAVFTWDGAMLAFGVSLAVGVLSGLFPAWRASRLDPIQALRYE